MSEFDDYSTVDLTAGSWSGASHDRREEAPREPIELPFQDWETRSSSVPPTMPGQDLGATEPAWQPQYGYEPAQESHEAPHTQEEYTTPQFQASVPPEPAYTLPEQRQSDWSATQMNDEAQLAGEIGRRLTAIANELGMLAEAVGELERRQQERDQAVNNVLAEIATLTSQLRAPMPPGATQHGLDEHQAA